MHRTSRQGTWHWRWTCTLCLEWGLERTGSCLPSERKHLSWHRQRRSRQRSLQYWLFYVLHSRSTSSATSAATVEKVKSFPSHMGPLDGADLRFRSPQPDTSLHCETTDTGLVHRVVCLSTSQSKLVLFLPIPEGWNCWVDLIGWLHAQMVYPPKDGHPSKY